MRFLHLLAVLTLLIAPWSASKSALGQNGGTTAGVSHSRQAPREIRHDLIKSMPSDLKLAFPPNSKFLAGYRCQYNPTTMITEVRFETQESKAKVRDWYQQSLSAAGWTVKANGAEQLTAMRPGFFCNLHFRDAGMTIGANAFSSSTPASIVLLNYSEKR